MLTLIDTAKRKCHFLNDIDNCGHLLNDINKYGNFLNDIKYFSHFLNDSNKFRIGKKEEEKIF